jgi:septum formation protein
MMPRDRDSGGAVYRTIQPLVLASSSPRRRELLSLLGLTFDVVVSGVDESPPAAAADPVELVRGWAREKAEAVSRLHPDRWVLGADTAVVLGGEIFGKPSSSGEAASMLERLSGRVHEVISAVCLTYRERRFVRVISVTTEVRFKKLSEDEIRAYVESGEPSDKAGAYGIQGLGAFLVESVRGSYTNVVGLPVCETVELLTGQGIIAPAGAGRAFPPGCVDAENRERGGR